MRGDLEIVGLSIFPFTPEDADNAALLWDADRGLSLADRACLTLARRLGLPVLTADATWKQRAVGVDVQLVR
jgi:PIN domain nuclease of toxin-antitoxin system